MAPPAPGHPRSGRMTPFLRGGQEPVHEVRVLVQSRHALPLTHMYVSPPQSLVETFPIQALDTPLDRVSLQAHNTGALLSEGNRVMVPS